MMSVQIMSIQISADKVEALQTVANSVADSSWVYSSTTIALVMHKILEYWNAIGVKQLQ